MSEQAFSRLIDCGFGNGRGAARRGNGAAAVPLMPDSGEYCAALRRLSAPGHGGPVVRGVPDEIYLHLYGYELLERMRERARERRNPETECLVLPFWPESLFHAAELPVHGAREIQALFPPARRTRYRRRPAEVVEEEARRVLGGVRFDPGAYLEALEAAAAEYGWLRSEEEG